MMDLDYRNVIPSVHLAILNQQLYSILSGKSMLSQEHTDVILAPSELRSQMLQI